ncbi:hypothetical protein LTR64_004749 [Lithohypha guttulata]|uniref:uncharacterized protein n=1 Tax=Lithohypha guttulata TaxID=1690604 RepID=UPI002DDFFFF5|nr:hypothetical protein LTR51_005954 [Lithohypha guttulata]
MFSEYASRFLAQSQSRIGFATNDDRSPGHHRNQNPAAWRSGTASRLGANRGGNPYNPASSQISNFPFASRFNPQQAPLFHSAVDEFREENDEEEHEREIADFYALQKSRRQLGGSDLKESGASSTSSTGEVEQSAEKHGGYGRAGGIRSSWRGGRAGERSRGPHMEDLTESAELDQSMRSDPAQLSEVRLEDTMRSEADDEPPEDLVDDPPSVQQLRQPYPESEEADESDRRHLLRERAEVTEMDATIAVTRSPADPVRHDIFFGHLYLLALAGMFATWFVIFLHTEAPSKNKPLGDTIYTTLHGSFHLLGVYTIVSVFVGLFWLAALRSYVRQLVFGTLIVVPIILFSFSLYPFISSFHGRWRGHSAQDNAMRWSSLLPFIMASLWVVAVIRGRLAMQKAVSIVEFATKILAANPALLLVGFTTLGAIIGFTWIWLSMFTRVFLGGHRVTSMVIRFAIDTTTWWIGIYFILVYLWTISILFGLQRTITSATVSQWYFHRLAVPQPTSQTIVKAAVMHSITTLFGTVSLFTGLSLLVRLPLLVLPRRLTMLLSVAMYSFIPSPVATLINPLSLTYAAIHSQPLAVSSRGLSQLHFLAPNDATTSLHPNTFNQRNNRDGWSADAAPLLPYRLSKLLLHATRFIMCLALGFGGWVSTARTLKLAGTDGVRGSLYAYVVGLIAGAIGWAVLGAMEGVLACIVDAVVVCWSSEVGSSGNGEVRYCREAGYLFGRDEDDRPVSLA